MSHTPPSLPLPSPVPTGRRGIALVSVIIAMTVIGVLVSGTFWLSTNEQRLGDNTRRLHKSFGVAEAGANELIRNWTVPSTLALYPADSFAIPLTNTASGMGSYSGYVYHLTGPLYL